MSNFATLKAAITAAVYTNGTNDITGAALQQVLLDIVNTVGGGYTFAGVATAGTSPGTPDQNVFYIAQAGTYNNFGTSYTVADGSIGIFKYNGSWTKSSILTEVFANDINVTAAYPTSGTGGGDTYSLAGAIATVPSKWRNTGVKVTFTSDGTDTGLTIGQTYTYEYQGTSWVVANFKRIDATSITDMKKYVNSQDETLEKEIDALDYTGGTVTATGTTALDQAGAITSSGEPSGPGTSIPGNYPNYLRTDYITLYRATRVVAYRCQNNTTTFSSAAVYDADKNFISKIPINSSNGDFDIQVSSYPNAAYIMFCGWASDNTNNNDFYYTIYYQNGRVTDLEQQVTTNTADITTIKGDIGYTLKDITDTATWTNGFYSASDGTIGSYNSNVWWRAGKCATFDITDYDVVNFTNALYQKTYCMVAYILGDGVLIDTIKGTLVEPQYPSGNLYLADYKGYTQVLMRINGSQNISVKATKNASWETTDLKRIVLDGDSLCNRVGPQLSAICHRFGYRLLNRSQGGENLIGNLTRAGGLMFRVAQEFTMPASGSVSVSLTSTWIDSNGNYSTPPYGTISTARTVWIAGIKGELTLSNSVFTFTRSESGTSFKVGTGVECYDNSLVNDKDYIHIWFGGQNDGYERNDEQYANLTDSASKFFNEKFIVVTTHTSVCTASLAKAAREKFGSKYLNIRDYLDGNAIYDALRWGLLSDTSLTPSDWESEMLIDTVHQDDVCAYIEAVQFWNRLVDLGYVDGDRVDDTQTFFNPTSAQLGYWLSTPQNGYGEYNYPF